MAFYEERRSGLGAAFTRAVETAIESILAEPLRYRRIEQDVRRCLTRTFPYAVLYTAQEDVVFILALVHGSREPGYWRHRVEPK